MKDNGVFEIVLILNKPGCTFCHFRRRDTYKMQLVAERKRAEGQGKMF